MPVSEIGPFGVTSMQVLDEQGNADRALEPALSGERHLALYRAMVLARAVDERALKLQRQGRIGTFGPNTGQEAASCGAAFAMGERDWLVSAFRELGAWLIRGMPAKNFFLFHNGYEEGNAYPAGSRNLPISIIVGAQLLHAVGIGYAMRQKGERDSAAVAFFGDGATSQGDFHEALNFAAVWQAPVVFLCQNNQWAISLPVKQQTHARSLAQKAIAYEMPGIQVDGNDVLGVYRATREALERAHRGEGPTLIEAVTYRLMMHTTSDDPTRYRTEAEVEAWRKKDPLPRYRAYLERRGLLGADAQKAVEEDVRAEVERAVQELEAFGPPRPDAPFDHVFASPPPGLEAQRQEFLAAIKREGGHGQA